MGKLPGESRVVSLFYATFQVVSSNGTPKLIICAILNPSERCLGNTETSNASAFNRR